jgi:hypothetical protein
MKVRNIRMFSQILEGEPNRVVQEYMQENEV